MVELINEERPALRNACITQQLPDDRSVFTFNQGIVIGLSARDLVNSISSLRNKSVTFFIVDIFQTVIRMEAFNDKGKTIQDLLNSGHQVLFTNFLNRTHHLELGHLTNRIDVIDAFVFVLVVLMDGVDMDKAGSPIGPWFSQR